VNTKSDDFVQVRELGKPFPTRNTQLGLLPIARWIANWWLYFALVGLVLACLFFAAVVWSILLSPIS
jgi:hypothetical protein